MKSIENKGITATIALKNEVAGETKLLFGLQKRRKQPRYAQFLLKFVEKYGAKLILTRDTLCYIYH
jgi:hypothetical protein